MGRVGAWKQHRSDKPCSAEALSCCDSCNGIVLMQLTQVKDLENASKLYIEQAQITRPWSTSPSTSPVLEALRNGPFNVTAVVDKTGLSQALVSKHLKLLTIAGVVQRRPQGSLVFYEVNDKAVFKLVAQAEKLMLASRRQQIDALAAIL